MNSSKSPSCDNLLESDDDGDLENFGADEEMMRKHFGDPDSQKKPLPQHPPPAQKPKPSPLPQRKTLPKPPTPRQHAPPSTGGGEADTPVRRRGPRSRAEEEANDSDEEDNDRGSASRTPTASVVTDHSSQFQTGEDEETNEAKNKDNDIGGDESSKKQNGTEDKEKEDSEEDKDHQEEEEEEDAPKSVESSGIESLLGVRHEESTVAENDDDKEEDEEDEEEEEDAQEQDQENRDEEIRQRERLGSTASENVDVRKSSVDSKDTDEGNGTQRGEDRDEQDPNKMEEPPDSDGNSHEGFQLGISVDRRKKIKKNKDKDSKSKIRYFVIRSSNHRNVTASVEKGVWATTWRNKEKFNEAFRTCDSVLLIFSVNKSQHFQGYARMASEITSSGKSGQDDWVDRKQGDGLTDSFKVDWLKLYDVPQSATEHIQNTLNDGNPVWFSRDGQEVDRASGEALCKLIDAGAAGNLHPTASNLSSESTPASEGAAANGTEPTKPLVAMQKPCFQFQNFGHCSFAANCKYRHDRDLNPQAVASSAGAKTGGFARSGNAWQNQSLAPLLSGQAAAGLESRKRKAGGSNAGDITNMTYEEYVAKHQRFSSAGESGAAYAIPQAHHYAQAAAAVAAAQQAAHMAAAHQYAQYGGAPPLQGQPVYLPPNYYGGAAPGGWWGGGAYPPPHGGYGGGWGSY